MESSTFKTLAATAEPDFTTTAGAMKRKTDALCVSPASTTTSTKSTALWDVSPNEYNDWEDRCHGNGKNARKKMARSVADDAIVPPTPRSPDAHQAFERAFSHWHAQGLGAGYSPDELKLFKHWVMRNVGVVEDQGACAPAHSEVAQHYGWIHPRPDRVQPPPIEFTQEAHTLGFGMYQLSQTLLAQQRPPTQEELRYFARGAITCASFMWYLTDEMAAAQGVVREEQLEIFAASWHIAFHSPLPLIADWTGPILDPTPYMGTVEDQSGVDPDAYVNTPAYKQFMKATRGRHTTPTGPFSPRVEKVRNRLHRLSVLRYGDSVSTTEYAPGVRDVVIPAKWRREVEDFDAKSFKQRHSRKDLVSNIEKLRKKSLTQERNNARRGKVEDQGFFDFISTPGKLNDTLDAMRDEIAPRVSSLLEKLESLAEKTAVKAKDLTDSMSDMFSGIKSFVMKAVLWAVIGFVLYKLFTTGNKWVRIAVMLGVLLGSVFLAWTSRETTQQFIAAYRVQIAKAETRPAWFGAACGNNHEEWKERLERWHSEKMEENAEAKRANPESYSDWPQRCYERAKLKESDGAWDPEPKECPSPLVEEESETSSTEGEVEDQAELNPDVVSFMSLAFGVLTIGSAPPGKRLTEMRSMLSSFRNVKGGIEEIVPFLCDKFVDLLNYVRVDWLKLDAVEGFTKISKEVDECTARATDLMRRFELGQLKADLATAQEWSAIRQRCVELATTTKIPRAHNALRFTVSRLDTIDGELRLKGFVGSGSRVEPTTFLLQGSTGVGKSRCAQMIYNEILMRVLNDDEKKRFMNDTAAFVYVRTAECKFWDGYRNQYMCFFDDFNQMKASVGDMDNELMNMIRCSNGFPALLHSADLSAKGMMYFTSRMIFGTTNESKIKAENLRHPEAVERRWQMRFIMYPAREFCTPETRNVEVVTERVPMWGKYDGKENVAVSSDRWEFRDAKSNKVYTFDQLVAHIVRVHKSNMEKEESFLEQLAQRRADLFANAAIPEVSEARDASRTDVLPAQMMSLETHSELSGTRKREAELRLQREMEEEPEEELRGRLADVEEEIYDQGADDDDVKLLMEDPMLDEEPRWVKSAFYRWGQRLKAAPGFLYRSVVDTKRRSTAAWWSFWRRCAAEEARLQSAWRARLARFKHSSLTGIKTCWSGVANWLQGRWALIKSNSFVQFLLSHWKWIILISGTILAGVLLFTGALKSSVEEQAYDRQSTDARARRMQKPNKQNIDALRARQRAYKTGGRQGGRDAKMAAHVTEDQGIDVTATEMADRIAMLNCFALFATVDGKRLKIGNVLAYHKDVVLVPYHYYKSIAAIGAKAHYTMERHPDFTQRVTVSQCDLMAHTSPRKESDYVSIRVRTPGYAHPKSLRGHFVDFEDLPAIGMTCKTTLVYYRVPTGAKTNTLTMMGQDAWLSVLSSPEHGERAVLAYKAPTVQGDCGTALILHDPRSNGRKVLGVHTQGIRTQGFGFASIVLNSDIEEMLAELQMGAPELTMENKLAEDQGLTLAPAILPNGLMKIYDVREKAAPRLQFSKLKPWVFLEDIPTTKAPAPLWKFKLDGVEVDPFEAAQARYASPHVALSDLDMVGFRVAFAKQLELCERAVGFNYLPESRVLLSYEEAIKGNPRQGWPGINMGTDCGWPWKTVRKPNEPGKRHWFGTKHVEGFDLDKEEAKEFIAHCEKVEEHLAKGGEYMFVFADHLKDELKSCEVGESPKKARLVSGSPMDHVVLMRRYCGTFLKFLREGRLRNGVAVGTNVYPDAGEWAQIHALLANFKKFLAGDFVGFDSGMLAFFYAVLADIINSWYGDKPGSANALVRKSLICAFANSYHFDGKHIVQWFGKFPSGGAATAEFNSLIEVATVRFAWWVVHGRNSYAAREFDSHIYALAYGDDHVVGLSDYAATKLSMFSYKEILTGLGMSYTNADKTEVDREHLKLEELTFLKRGFVWKGEKMLCPLDLKTIIHELKWRKKTSDRKMDLDRFESALRELSMHPASVWDEIVPKLAKPYYDWFGTTLHQDQETWFIEVSQLQPE